jgi:hypothetical protein
MPLIRFNEHYLVQDGVRFLMTEDGERPVACRVSRGALHDLAAKVGFHGSDDDIFETYRSKRLATFTTLTALPMNTGAFW